MKNLQFESLHVSKRNESYNLLKKFTKHFDMCKLPGRQHSWFYIFHNSAAEMALEVISADYWHNSVVFLTRNCSCPRS